jgi:cold shock CspA family protein
VNGISNWFNGNSGNSFLGPPTGSTDYGSNVAQTSSVQDLSQGYTVTDLGAYQGAV